MKGLKFLAVGAVAGLFVVGLRNGHDIHVGVLFKLLA